MHKTEPTYEVYDVDNDVIYAEGMSYEDALGYSLSLDDAGFDTDIRQEYGYTDAYIILV